MEQRMWKVSASPHLNDKESISKIMWLVAASLAPAGIGAVYFFGAHAAWVIFWAVVAAVGTEAAIQKLMGKPVTVSDGSAFVTGLLLAYNMPAESPFWLPIIGSIFAIGLGKQIFGGLGYNPMNPALLGRAFLLASWPTHMTIFKTPPHGGTISGIDVETGATPLNLLKLSQDVLRQVKINPAEVPAQKVAEATEHISKLYDAYGNLFWGKVGGCLGETSVFLLLLGAAFLLYKRYIDLRIPVGYIGTVALLTWMFGGTDGLFTGNPLFHVLAGGLILGAFFMATDMVTSPITPKGQWAFGIGCGVITVVIRLIGGYPEGVSYSILLMNLTVPLLDRWAKPTIFGGAAKK